MPLRTDEGIVFRGKESVALRFRLMRSRVNNIDPAAWTEVGDYLATITAEQFALEGGRLGTPWVPLAPYTVKYKAAHGFPPAALIRTYNLFEDFIDRPMNFEKYNRKSAYFGSRSDVAVWQHYGTPTIPARPILYVTEEIKDGVADILADYIVNGS